jgi:DNA (cytosine-5)-methyltransferase 1
MTNGLRKSATRSEFALLDLFSGCGGLTKGFVTTPKRQTGFVPVGAVELDPFAAATYASNFGPHVFQGDIADWIRTGLPRADVVIGGPPCQGFSALGKRDPDDRRNALWSHYAEVVAKVRPLYFVLENVSPFLRSEQFRQLERATRVDGALCDYTLDGSPLDVVASSFGAAQKRRRALVVGRLRDLPPIDMTSMTREARTVRDVIGTTARVVRTKDLPERQRSVRVANGRVRTPGVFLTSELHVTRNFTKLSMDRFRAIKPGGNRRDLPAHLLAPCWRDHHDGSHDVMGRLHWDRPSVTIRTEFWKPEKGRYLHPEANRPITHLEAALLQGFPMDFRWCGTKVSVGRQIGNAVPVELARAVASAVLQALDVAGASPRS